MIALVLLALCCMTPVITHATSVAAPCAYCDPVYESGHTQALTSYYGCTAASQGNSYVLAGCLAGYYAAMAGVYTAWNMCEQTAPIAGLCLEATEPTEAVVS